MLFLFVCYISLCIILLCMFQFTRYVDHSSFRLFAYILYTRHVLYIHVPQSLYVSACKIPQFKITNAVSTGVYHVL